jgi:DNA primase
MGLMKSVEERGLAAGVRRASRIPDAYLHALNDRADIEKIIGARVKLKKAGGDNLVGLCPFHSERSPSFTVSRSKGFYHCFGCGAHGRPLSFLMESDGMPFREAVRALAQEVGMPEPEALAPRDAQAIAELERMAAERTSIQKVNRVAASYFRHGLSISESAREYLAERGLDVAKARDAGYVIGFAPGHWNNLMEAFPSDYSTNPALLSSGLVRKSESGRAFDLFRNRIIFGLRDMRGQLIAFGGRVVPKLAEAGREGPKYLNSPESAAFDKSRELFGLFEAKEAIRKQRFAYVVEGYMDVLGLFSCGVHNAVAAMGTALTPHHIERLMTQCDAVVFAFDGDEAGDKAAWRASESLLPMLGPDVDVRVMLIPGGLDPDEFVRAKGVGEFQKLTEQAPDVLGYMLRKMGALHDCSHPAGRDRFLAQAQVLRDKLPRGRLAQEFWRDARKAAGLTDGRDDAGGVKPLKLATGAGALVASSTSGKFWTDFLVHILQAPNVAVECGAEIIEYLDTEEPEEEAVIETLRARMQAQGSPCAETTNPALRDVSADFLRHAAVHIMRHRIGALRESYAQAFHAGEISETEYWDAMSRLSRQSQEVARTNRPR